MSNQKKDNKTTKKKLSSKNREAFQCRMYENAWPKVGDVVMVVPIRIEELGAYCHLLEYNNKQGLMLLSELQRRRIRSVKRVIRVGRKEVAIVVKVNKNKEYIDLSRKRVTPEERDAMDIKWNKSKTVHSIMKRVSTLTDYKYTVEQLYQMFGWKMYRKFKHAYDGFKLAMSDKQKFLDIMNDKIEYQISSENNNDDEEEEEVEESDVEDDEEDEDKENDDTNTIELNNGNKGIPDEIVDLLFQVVEKRLKAKMVTVRARVEITCFTKYGINGIKDALKAGLSKINNANKNNNNSNNSNNNSNDDGDVIDNDDEQCVIKLIAPPDYNISIDTFDSDEALQRLNKVIKTITNEIQKYGGSLKIKEDPHVINLETLENTTQEDE